MISNTLVAFVKTYCLFSLNTGTALCGGEKHGMYKGLEEDPISERLNTFSLMQICLEMCNAFNHTDLILYYQGVVVFCGLPPFLFLDCHRVTLGKQGHLLLEDLRI